MYEKQIESLEEIFFSFRNEIAVTVMMKTGHAVFAMKYEDDASYLEFLSHPTWSWDEYFGLLHQLLEDGGSMILRERTDLTIIENEKVVHLDKVYGLRFADETFYKVNKNELKQLYTTDFKTGESLPKPEGVIYCEL